VLSWVVDGADGPLARRDPDLRPSFVAAEARTPAAPRTLVLRGAAGTIGYDVVREVPPRLGSAETPPARRSQRALDAVVADLVSGRASDAPARLSVYGVRYLFHPAPVDSVTTRTLDATAGLSRVGLEGRAGLWRVVPPAGRLVLLTPALARPARAGEAPTAATLRGSPPQVLGSDRLPTGPAARLLVLAETKDGGWHAELDGRPLRAATAWGWAQAWEVPAGAGVLDVHRDGGPRRAWLAGQALLVVLAVALAIPGGRREAVPAPPTLPSADDAPDRSGTLASSGTVPLSGAVRVIPRSSK
jgi:hypothetical protein